MIFGDSGLADQLLHQHLAKAAWMRNRQAYIFVQVKSFHSRPINSRSASKQVEKLDLGSCGCRNDSCVPFVCNCVADSRGSLPGSGLTERRLVREYFQSHREISLLPKPKRSAAIIIAKLRDESTGKICGFLGLQTF